MRRDLGRSSRRAGRSAQHEIPNLGEHHAAVAALLHVIATTTDDPAKQGYARVIRCYAEDLDRTWG